MLGSIRGQDIGKLASMAALVILIVARLAGVVF